jgi:hypothetical protein
MRVDAQFRMQNAKWEATSRDWRMQRQTLEEPELQAFN